MEVKTVCRLCLKSCETIFEYVEAVTLEMLTFLGVELDLNISEQPVLCRTCSGNLRKCFDFKTVCHCTEDCIKSFRSNGNNVKVNLREIHERKNKNGNIPVSECNNICRLCMEIAESGCIPLNDQTRNITSAKAILRAYFSELDLEITKNPVICTSCNESLRTYFGFINCLDVKGRIKKYKTEENANKPQVELKSVLPFETKCTSNYENSCNNIGTFENCDESKLHIEIKLESENLMQEGLHIKHEDIDHDEADCVKIEELNDIVGKCHEGDKSYGIGLKCENFIEIESPQFKNAHEGIDIEMNDGTSFRFQNNVPILKDASALTFSCSLCTYKTKRKGYLKRHTLTHNLNNAKMTGNHIDTILNADFKTLPLAEKLSIKTLGRPTPEINLTQPDRAGARTFTRHFSKDIYKKSKWISGCNKVNAMFCFPCVLFYSDGMDKTWSVTGFRDLKHLNQRMKKHEISAHHIKCCTDLALLGSVNNAVKLNSAYRLHIIQHNEQVTKNKYTLKKIINCIKYCGKLELTLRGHDESSQNRGILLEPIDFSSELEAILKEDLNIATVFKRPPKTLQNEILESMLVVCREEIKEQIGETDFLAIQSDETADISHQRQTAIILRYYYNGNLYERFWTFLRATDKSAEDLTQCIQHEVNELISNSPSKLIAQSYDGAIVMSGVQSKIKQKYEYAQFVHCYAHQLNLIVQKATSGSTKVKMFFTNLTAIPSFFSSSSHRCDMLEQIVNRKLPKLAAARWIYNMRTVNVVFENREKLIECFEELEEKCTNTITCREAYGLRRILEDRDFIYFLNLFHKIFVHVDGLFNQFQARNTDSTVFTKKVEKFEKNVSSLRNSTCEIENEVVNIENENKRKRLNPENRNSAIAKDVCDVIIFHMKERLSFRGHLEAASLVNVDSFPIYSKKFPLQIFKSVVESYPMLQEDKLKTELEVIYSKADFKYIIGGLNVLSWLLENDLNETFSETVKLLKIIVTTPMSTAESGRCFSTLKRIETFLTNAIDEERLNALAMMSVNQNLIHNISNFDEKVMEHFTSQKDRKPDFMYKQ